MKRHFATYTDQGPCVAMQHYMGPVVVMECATIERAQREAGRLNWEAAAREAIPKRTSAHYGMRRSVRKFVNEDIHG